MKNRIEKIFNVLSSSENVKTVHSLLFSECTRVLSLLNSGKWVSLKDIQKIETMYNSL